MATLILDRDFAEELRQQRAKSGADRWDEVWEGTYIMSPMPNVEHQQIVSFLTGVLFNVVMLRGQGQVLPGTNVSDRQVDWIQNYRCPDVAVYLNSNSAQKCENHWVGGPDLAIEVLSPDDRSYEKLSFYESIGTRELLLVDRYPWKIELFRLEDNKLVSCGVSLPNGRQILHSLVLPITLQLLPASGRPQLEIRGVDDSTRWVF
jgi:Uma2 family endonuclease